MASSIRASAWPLLRVSRWPAPLRRAGTLLSVLFLALVLLAALLADRVTPYGFSEREPANRLQAPSPRHLLGTDDQGRDVLSRLVYGARVSLSVALCVEAVELLFGLSLGML
ncbi:MAG TPA: ABC transporter, partial [Armatimonadota bacterium]|nr:ABC transporter [Armatimonadota bacterium]